MAEPVRFYHATCGGISGVLFARRGRRLFLPTEAGPLHVIQPEDIVVVLGEIVPSMTAFVEQEVAAREAEPGGGV